MNANVQWIIIGIDCTNKKREITVKKKRKRKERKKHNGQSQYFLLFSFNEVEEASILILRHVWDRINIRFVSNQIS